jgi:hypothetical protein
MVDDGLGSGLSDQEEAPPDAADPLLELMLEERARSAERLRQEKATIFVRLGAALGVLGVAISAWVVIAYVYEVRLRQTGAAVGVADPSVQLTAFGAALAFGLLIFAGGAWLVLKGIEG